jgi:hypothetical protein
VANSNDSFIDEVAEAVRRERLNLWFRRWGWLVALLILAIVGGAAAWEWQRSSADSAAQARGDAILSALETPDDAARFSALTELPTTGEEGLTTAFLLAAEQQQAGDSAEAVATLSGIAQDAGIADLYRDLASLKAAMIQGPEADPATLEALAAPGEPYRLLAAEQLALIDLGADRRDEAVARLQAIVEDAEISGAQQSRVSALLTALGAPPQAEAAPAAELPAPAEE